MTRDLAEEYKCAAAIPNDVSARFDFRGRASNALYLFAVLDFIVIAGTFIAQSLAPRGAFINYLLEY